MNNVIELPEREADEPHDGSCRIEKWNYLIPGWLLCGTFLDVDHAKQQLAIWRKTSPINRYRLSPPGTRGYDERNRRIGDGPKEV